MNSGGIINKAALHRVARSEFALLGITGPLPKGGMAELETYLSDLAVRNVRAWAAKRFADRKKSTKEENHP